MKSARDMARWFDLVPPDLPPSAPARVGGSLAALLSAALTLALLLGAGVVFRVLPADWNPLSPLTLAAEPGLLTDFKLARLDRTPGACAALLGAEGVPVAPAREDGPGCRMRDPVRLTSLSRARLDTVDTACRVALRLWFWERHDLQPAARALLGSEVAEITHFSSYACRPMRTVRGGSRALSEHATGNAIDISGVVLADGRRISLAAGWGATGPEAAFLRRAHRSACRWFRTALGPGYNRLHADHLHLDMGRWRACR